MEEHADAIQAVAEVTRWLPRPVNGHPLPTSREACPYLHPKLSSVDLKATLKNDPAQMSDEELVALMAGAGEQPTVN